MTRSTPGLPRLLLLTDRSQLRLGRGLVRTVRECVGSGLTHVVVREHDLAPDARSALIRALADIPGLRVIISHPAALSACNAGLLTVEWPISTHFPSTAPHQMRGGGLVGRSCHTAEEVRRAAAEGADYVTLSPFAESLSKPSYGPPVDRDAFTQDLGIPVFALGGITVVNAPSARDTGAHGVAVMGEVMRSGDPAATTARLLSALG